MTTIFPRHAWKLRAVHTTWAKGHTQNYKYQNSQVSVTEDVVLKTVFFLWCNLITGFKKRKILLNVSQPE